jgi:carboxyl-terminal processing protease
MESKQTGGEVKTVPTRTAAAIPKPKRRWPRWLARFAVVVIVFSLGMAVGNGTISLHRQRGRAGDLPTRLDYTTVNQVYRSLVDNYDGKLTETQLENGLKHGLATAANDPYTEYFTPQEAKKFNEQLNNQFSGIGAELGKDSEGNLQIIAPIAGTPAAQAGLQAQDLIAAINGTSTSGMSVDAAVNKIRGPAGTKVTLQIVRNKTTPQTLTITRQHITVPSVTTKVLPGNIGYLQISSFANDTTGLTQKAAEQFKQQHVKGIVLDLRNDPGGLLDAAVHVSSLWLPEGKLILQEKRGDEVTKTYRATGGDILNGIPTAVLTNGGSASASEIVAGALRDNNAAYVIGQKTYGKGVVQQLINFKDDSQLKVTIASWYRPNGQNINKKGINPDQTVKPAEGDKVGGPDAQLQAAETYLASH